MSSTNRPLLPSLLLITLGLSLLALEGMVSLGPRGAPLSPLALRGTVGLGLPARVQRRNASTNPEADRTPPQSLGPMGVVTYAVQAGDTLGDISLRFYGRASNWRLILRANQDILPGPHRLKVGTVLKIPPAAG